MDYPSSDASDEGESPAILGLEAFDFEEQYDRYASNPVTARIFDLAPPEASTGPLRRVDLNDAFGAAMLQACIVIGIAMAAINSLVCWVLRWGVAWLSRRWAWPWSWSWYATISVHVLLIVMIEPSGWKRFAVNLYRVLRGRRGVDTTILTWRAALVLVYAVSLLAVLIMKKFAWVLLKPVGYVPPILLLLYKLGLVDSIFAYAAAARERAWLAWMRSSRRCIIAYQDYSKQRGQADTRALYEYQTTWPGEIRLVELQRAHPLARLRIGLRTCRLENSPHFQAISYTWGDNKSQYSITVDRGSLSINRNAYDVLYAMAPAWGSRLIWIDSVCINQRDDEDKNRQVALMADIYRRASNTLAWLGEPAESEYAVLQLRRLGRVLTTGGREAHHELGVLKQRALNLDSYQHWRALAGLLTHPYWTRVWILQEIAVSRDIHVLYGTHRIQMTTVIEAVEGVWASKTRDRIMETPWKGGAVDARTIINHLNIRVTAGIRRLIGRGVYPDLREVVRMTAFFDATDPRDKIYAFYNIASVQDDLLKADYRVSVKEAYTRFATHFMQKHFSEMLFMAGHCQPRQHADLPSWVPDFTTKGGNATQVPTPRINPKLQDPYTASGDEIEFMPRVSLVSKYCLRVHGYYVDRIEHITATAIELTWDETYIGVSPSALHAWHADAVALALALTPDRYRSYDESRRQAFVRTLVGDRSGGSGAMAPTKYKGYYRHWVSFLATAIETGRSLDTMLEDDESESGLAALEFNRAVIAAIRSRRFSVTKDGYMALVPRETIVGDVVCVFQGITVPFVLRPVAGTVDNYELVGPCYCHGIMTGEVVSHCRARDLFIQ